MKPKPPVDWKARRDRDWILAMTAALGSDSGFKVPIVPEAEPFSDLFAAMTAPWIERAERAEASDKSARAAWEGLRLAAHDQLAELRARLAACEKVVDAVRQTEDHECDDVIHPLCWKAIMGALRDLDAGATSPEPAGDYVTRTELTSILNDMAALYAPMTDSRNLVVTLLRHLKKGAT